MTFLRRVGLVPGMAGALMVAFVAGQQVRPVFTAPDAAGPQAGRGRGAPPAAPTGPQLLHPMFQDHGVVQRDRAFRVYGEAAPGTTVTVTFATAMAQAVARADGRWATTLPAMAAGGPYTLTATANGESSTAVDVLVGDVFFCSGQSNMAFSQRQAQGAADDARTAADAWIRHFNVPTNASLTPRQTFATLPRWVVASPESVGSFSAACYYFARELKKTVNVPIGIVTAAYGGARLRTFMSEEALRTGGLENEDLDILDEYRQDPAAALRRWGVRWESWWSAARPKDGGRGRPTSAMRRGRPHLRRSDRGRCGTAGRIQTDSSGRRGCAPP